MRRTFNVHVDGLDEPMLIISNPDEGDLVDMRERLALKSWRKARFSCGRTPTIGELGVGMVAQLEPNLMELEILPDGDMRYRTYGKGIAAAYGKDMTGKKTSDLPSAVSKAFLSIYQLAGKLASLSRRAIGLPQGSRSGTGIVLYCRWPTRGQEPWAGFWSATFQSTVSPCPRRV